MLPDRAQVTMTVPFMRAYTQLLVKTCHRRGAHAIGGMAAFIPSRRDPEVNESRCARVREDKEREAGDGFDGTWVAHPDLVPVATEIFDRVLGERPNQKERLRDDVQVDAAELLDLRVPGGAITEAGVRNNVSVGLQYLDSWLRGNGAAAINNLMEDAATAEISRAQLWQWIHHGAPLDDGRAVTAGATRRSATRSSPSSAARTGALRGGRRAPRRARARATSSRVPDAAGVRAAAVARSRRGAARAAAGGGAGSTSRSRHLAQGVRHLARGVRHWREASATWRRPRHLARVAG